MTASPGFFGKVPARGDFLGRRVPHWPEANWEDWLAAFTVAAREALGDAWPEDWLTAPLWHFTLGAEIAPPHGAAGVLVASADRVGRLFPFTLIAPAATTGASLAADRRAADDWSRTAETLTFDALEDGFDPDALDAALQSLGPPPAFDGAPLPTGNWPLELDNDWPARNPDTLEDPILPPPGPRQSTWWCRGSDRMAPISLRCTGLPGPALSAAMITGLFE